MKSILCIGNASYDITMPMEAYPIENFKYRVKDVVECGGGPASNAAFLLGKWDTDVYFAGVVGKDNYGKKIEQEFKDVKVNTKYLDFDKENDTTISFIIVNKKNGSRTAFAYRNKDMKYSKKMDLKADVILTDGQEYDVSIEALNNNPNAISIIDAGRFTDKIIDLAKRVNYVVCSKDFAESYTGIRINIVNNDSIKGVYSKMEKDFKNVIITLEDKGCLYRSNGNINLMPSIKVTQVDSTGAGDFFHGAFAYCLLKEYDIEKSVKISNITGALSVTKLGARNSAPELDEVIRIYEQNV